MRDIYLKQSSVMPHADFMIRELLPYRFGDFMA